MHVEPNITFGSKSIATVHLLSFLDERSLAKAAQVSKAWNKFASDNTIWRRIYFKRGWSINQDMVDWYLRWGEHEDQWPLGPNGMHPRIHFDQGPMHRGKRKMLDYDLKEVREADEDYEMVQDTHADGGQYSGGEQPAHELLDHFRLRSRSLGAIPPYLPSLDVDMGRLPEEDEDDDTASSPIAFPASPPAHQASSPSPLPTLLESSMAAAPPGRRVSSASMRTPSAASRHGRFSLSNTSFMPSLQRPRMPTYSLGSSLMTPPSMLKKLSRGSPPLSLRIPSFQGGSSSTSPSTSRHSRFFGHPRSSIDQNRPVLPPGPSQVTPPAPSSGPVPPAPAPAMPGVPNPPNNPSSGLHSPLAAKSLWSVIRWPSLHSHRHSDAGEAEVASSSSSSTSNQQQPHQGQASLSSWLMHFNSPLAGASSRHQRNSITQSNTLTNATTPPPSNGTNSPETPDSQTQAIPQRIDYASVDAPLPSDILRPDTLHIHCDPATKQPMINWKFLCQQRKLLERNWNQGVYFAKELPGHKEGIYCIQFDDHKIVSGSRDNTIKIWDLTSERCLRTYSGHNASVLCLQYDEGRIVSGSSDTSIIVWDLESGKVLQRLTGHADSVLSLRFENDTVVSCSKDRTVKIWQISTGEMVRTLVGHRAAVNAVQFSPEGSSSSPAPFVGSPRVVVSASGDKTIKIWSFETGECLRTLEGHARGIACIQFEGNIIVSGSSDRSIKIWDVTRGECIRTLDGHEGLVRTLQFTGKRIISGGYDETLKIWDRESGKMLANMVGQHSHRVFKLQFNDSKIVSCSQDQKVIRASLFLLPPHFFFFFFFFHPYLVFSICFLVRHTHTHT